MIDWIVGFALRKRLVMMAVAILTAMFGYYSWTQLALEAYPDIADVTSQVITQAPGLAAEEVEQQITIPSSASLTVLPAGRHPVKEHVRPVIDHAGLPRWCRGLLVAATHP
jgi:cobalt-zinc-cadmium resistance protein CzcA